MKIYPYTQRTRFSNLKEGSIIQLDGVKHNFTINRIDRETKKILLKGFEGYWWKCEMFYIDMER